MSLARIRKVCLLVKEGKYTLGVMDKDAFWFYCQDQTEFCSLWQMFGREDISFIINEAEKQLVKACHQQASKQGEMNSFQEIVDFLKKHKKEKESIYHSFFDLP